MQNSYPVPPPMTQAPVIAQQDSGAQPGMFSPQMLAAAMGGMQNANNPHTARGDTSPRTGLEGIGRLAEAVQAAHQKANPQMYDAKSGAYTGGPPQTGWGAVTSGADQPTPPEFQGFM